jgi:hypothetical protein
MSQLRRKPKVFEQLPSRLMTSIEFVINLLAAGLAAGAAPR